MLPSTGISFARVSACIFAIYSPIILSVQDENPKEKTAILVAAAIICAVRTAKEERILPTSPVVVSKVADSIRLARMLWDRIVRGS